MKRIAFCVGLFVLASPMLRSQSLEEDPLIHYYFSEEEVDQLQSIVHFFDEYVTRDCDRGAPFCLGTFADTLADTFIATRDIPDIFDDTLFDSMLDSLSSAVLNEIWRYGSQKKKNSSDDSVYHYWKMGYRMDGRYFKFLSASSYITDTTLKHYIEPAEASGDMSPSMLTYLLLNHRKYDLYNERNRLIFAIHCITLEGHQMPKFDRDVLRIKNSNSSPILVEVWAYPTERYKNSQTRVFHDKLNSRQSFTLTFDGLYFSEKNVDLSIARSKFDQERFDLIAYKSLEDSQKDTLLVKSFTVQELIDQSPVITIP